MRGSRAARYDTVVLPDDTAARCRPPCRGEPLRRRDAEPSGPHSRRHRYDTVVLPDDTAARCRPPVAVSRFVAATRSPPGPTRGDTAMTLSSYRTTPRPGAVPLSR